MNDVECVNYMVNVSPNGNGSEKFVSTNFELRKLLRRIVTEGMNVVAKDSRFTDLVKNTHFDSMKLEVNGRKSIKMKLTLTISVFGESGGN